MAEAGYEVQEVEPPSLLRGLELFLQLTSLYRQSQASQVRLESVASEGMIQMIRAMRPGRGRVSGPPSHDALLERLELAQAWEKFQADQPLILGPVATVQPFGVDFETTASSARRFHKCLTRGPGSWRSLDRRGAAGLGPRTAIPMFFRTRMYPTSPVAAPVIYLSVMVSIIAWAPH